MPHVCGCVSQNITGYTFYSRWWRTVSGGALLPCVCLGFSTTITPPGMFPGGVIAWHAASCRVTEPVELLDRNGGAGALKGSLGLLRGLLVDLLKHGLRRAVDQVLGLLKAQAGERAHLLDDLDLLVARGLKDDVELVLLLGLFRRGSGARTASGGGNRDRGRGLDVERLLERL